MYHKAHNVGVAKQIGLYSDAIEVGPNKRWLFISGTPGLTADGKLPEGIVAQSEVAWKHVIAMLEKADMTVDNLVKVTQYLTKPEDIVGYRDVRTKYCGDARPTFMFVVVPQTINSDYLIEIEAIAAADAK